MITAKRFLEAVEENAARVERYEKGGDGTGGGCDCIGLIIGALKKCGEAWTGTHGSNYAARNAMKTLGYISSPDECFLGEVVYKAHEPGESGYDAEVIGNSYKDSHDKRDYYHVGVVTGLDPLVITHCTSVGGKGGIYIDNALGKWRWGGQLKMVNYEESEPEEPLYRAKVYAGTGKTVRMRIKPNTNANIIEEIPIGTEVEVNDVMDGWSQITYHGVGGYMMSKFLRPIVDGLSADDVAALKVIYVELGRIIKKYEGE